jgi:transposase InsO family protein
VLFLQDKSETQGTLKRFLRRAQNKFELKVKKIRSDNGSEFKNLQVEEYLEEEGVKHEFSAPYTPQQNGVVERKNRTLIDMARTMLRDRDENRNGNFRIPEIVFEILPKFRSKRKRKRLPKIWKQNR